MGKQKPLLTGASDWCGPKPNDPSPIVYHGGVDGKGAAQLIAGGQPNFCLSYYAIGKNGTGLKDHPSMDPKTMGRRFLDSGAFSFLSSAANADAINVDEYLNRYVTWVKSAPIPLDFYVTFDYKIRSALIYEITADLNKRGIKPTVVYHGDAGIDWLKKYIDLGHKFICLSKRNFLLNKTGLLKFYDQAFNLGEKHNVRFHGLACGIGAEIWDYPWWSVDASTIARTANLGGLLLLRPSTMRAHTLSIAANSPYASKTGPEIMKYATEWGLSLSELQTDSYKRIFFNAKMVGEVQKLRKAKKWTNKSLF